jgi:hypothetical protein
MRRLLLGLALAALVLPAAAGTTRRPAMKVLNPLNLLGPARPVHDAVIRGRPPRALADDPVTTYFTQPGNVPVRVAVSPDYTQGIAPQELVNFLGSLLHGDELSRLVVYVQPPSELSMTCGADAVACYFAGSNRMLIAGQDAPGVALEQVVAHEYGHHIAANRSNAPWPAIAYGPKRWASYVNVCRNARRREVFPGAEVSPAYERNPGEGWAESYRYYSAQRAATWEPLEWRIVAPFFKPDSKALELVQRDVVDPWAGATKTVKSGAVGRGGVRIYGVHTPYDGILHASVQGRGASVRIANSHGRALTRPAASASYTVCGARNLELKVRSRLRTAFRLTISRP